MKKSLKLASGLWFSLSFSSFKKNPLLSGGLVNLTTLIIGNDGIIRAALRCTPELLETKAAIINCKPP